MIVPAKLLLANLLTDFVFQSSALASWKARSPRGLLIHGVIYAVVSMGVGVGTWSARYGLLVLLLALVHIGIDWGKVRVDRSTRDGYWPLVTFLLDQALHIASIVALSAVVGFISIGSLLRWLTTAWGNVSYTYLASLYVAALFGGSIFVRLTTRIFQVPNVDPQGVEGAGAYIGVVERLAIMTLVALGQYGAVGLVLAAKSVARYKKIEEEKGFGEYFLIGTLTSSAIAILAGLAVNWVLQSASP